jgi:hypothetical protein
MTCEKDLKIAAGVLLVFSGILKEARENALPMSLEEKERSKQDEILFTFAAIRLSKIADQMERITQ